MSLRTTAMLVDLDGSMRRSRVDMLPSMNTLAESRGGHRGTAGMGTADMDNLRDIIPLPKDIQALGGMANRNKAIMADSRAMVVIRKATRAATLTRNTSIITTDIITITAELSISEEVCHIMYSSLEQFLVIIKW